jgi:hypothetical protein
MRDGLGARLEFLSDESLLGKYTLTAALSLLAALDFGVWSNIEA